VIPQRSRSTAAATASGGLLGGIGRQSTTQEVGLPVPHSSPSLAFSPPRAASVPPALVAQRRLPTTISLSKLYHAALALTVYASQPSFPLSRSYCHARLASGWWPTFTGRGSRPRKVPNEVSAASTWLPPHPSFRNASNVRVSQQPPLP
jgi:hypothetical protein